MENISDQELRQQLKTAGLDVGPITNTSRGVYQRLLQKKTQQEIIMNKPIPVVEPGTPTTRSAAKRAQQDDETVIDEEVQPKKKKGIPSYSVRSLRRSTVESTSLSRRLAKEAKEKKPIEPRNTETPAVLKNAIQGVADDSKETGLRNTNKLNVTNKLNMTGINSTPGYMRATTATKTKGSNLTGTKQAASGFGSGPTISRSKVGVRGVRKSFKRAGRPTPRVAERKENIPKVGGSGINKAKDSVAPAKAGKKKRSPWDVKGKLEDVTNLYMELKEEKKVQDEKVLELDTDLKLKTEEHDFLTIELDQTKSDLTTTRTELAEKTTRCTEQAVKLEAALIERDEKVSSYERVKRERDELEEDIQKFKAKLRESENRVDDLERDVRRGNNAREEVEENLAKSKKNGLLLEEKIADLKRDIEMHQQTISKRDSKIMELEGTLEKERGEKGDVHNILRRKESQIEGLDAKILSLENDVQELKGTIKERNTTIEKLQTSLSREQRDHGDVNRILEARDASIRSFEEQLAGCMKKLHAGEVLRRKLHNTIQELKGNIRVYCRVRPFLPSEVITGQPLEEIPQMEFKCDNTSLVVSSLQGDKLGRKGESLNHDFSFDHVFGPKHTQEDTFEEVSGLVQSSLDGFNVCIFAYGQTGSGKTHTMQGPIDPTSPDRGVIPRAMEQVFQTGEAMAEQGWEYVFTASFLEIYNEQINDLISNNTEKIEIKLINEKTRDVEVTNVKHVVVQNTYDVHQLLLKANKNRTVAATKCNERSSRSHSVFRLKIEGKNIKNGESCMGYLNLVDLAGSERVAHSGSTGQRLKEAQAINQSLSELGNVIMALNEKKPHVPYRNSKLTYLLCNSLGGNSKTLMFVNVSPLDKHTAESINSLRFASKVNRVDLGTAKKNK